MLNRPNYEFGLTFQIIIFYFRVVDPGKKVLDHSVNELALFTLSAVVCVVVECTTRRLMSN